MASIFDCSSHSTYSKSFPLCLVHSGKYPFWAVGICLADRSGLLGALGWEMVALPWGLLVVSWGCSGWPPSRWVRSGCPLTGGWAADQGEWTCKLKAGTSRETQRARFTIQYWKHLSWESLVLYSFYLCSSEVD